MHNCHSQSYLINLSQSFGLDNSTIVFLASIILTGVLGSFTHCIGMCGPIAMMQSSMRLMHIKSQKMQESQKIKASLATPYYLGKASTYTLYFLLAELLTSSFKNFDIYNYFIATLMMISGVAFSWLAISKNFNFLTPVFSNKAKKKSILEKIISKLNLKPIGLRGYFMGIILGMVPCGFVYAVIIAIVAYVEDIALGAFVTFIFGLSTIPGLFIVSYFGNYILQRYKSIFSISLRILAAINAFLLFNFAYSLLFVR